MTGSLTLALNTAQSGLLTSQSALTTVANNISNVSSTGYSRKNVNMESRVVNGAGAGVQLSGITRQIDEGLLKTLRTELGNTAALDVKSSFFDRLQDLFGAPADNSSLAHAYSDFSAALESLATTPDRTLEQSEVVRRAVAMTLQMQQMTTTIQDLRRQADSAISDTVDRINELVSTISDLNDKIVQNSVTTRDVTDFLDQRDQAVTELGQLLDITYYSRSDGDIVVFTTGGRTLVDNSAATLTHTAASTVDATTTHAQGDLGGIYVGSEVSGNDITDELRSGKLKGLVDLRDEILPNLQSQLDELAAETRDVFNQIHNRGLPFPGMQSMTGTRVFVDPTTQTMTLDPTSGADDVTIALFDSNGDQQAVTTLNTIMTSASYGTGAQADHGAWTITEVAASIEDWLQANGASTATAAIDSSGHLAIDLNAPSLSLGFRDQTASANGSTLADAEIGFDSGGTAAIDETVSGFSNFFGLNDFFVDGMAENVYESDVVSGGFTATAATLRFNDGTGLLGGSPLAIAAGTSLSDLATQITNNVTNVTADVVPDGSGYRLRISHANGASLVITQDTGGGDTLLTDLGMHLADVSVAANLTVRSDIVSSPSNISGGTIQWNGDLGAAGEYYTSIGDDTVIKDLAEQFSATNAFDVAGGLGATTSTFDQYAASILSRNSVLASTNEDSLKNQKALSDSLQLRSDSISGVNLDEEMALLILYQQTYSASARVIATVQSMFDALERAV